MPAETVAQIFLSWIKFWRICTDPAAIFADTCHDASVD